MSNIAFQIGSHRLDPARRELERDGALVALTPHVFDCLTYLVIHRERAIGRDELIAAVWGTVEVSDTLLSQTVMHARRAVGDNGADQRCIRTIPRYGFRWVGAVVPLVEEMPDTGTPTPSEPAPSDTGEWHAKAPAAPPPRRFWRLLAAALAGVAIVVLLGVSLYARRETTTTQAASARDPDLVLVLPVRVADTRETAWIPLGVMDAIAGHLRTRRWSVVPSATAVAIANRMATGDSALPAPEWTHAGTVARPSARHDGRTWNVRIDLAGVGDLPPWVQAEAPELLDAARLAADRLLAVLRRQPLPELSRDDPDLAVSVVLQRVQAEFLAGRLDAAAAILASTPAAILAQPDIALKAAELDYRAGRLERAAEAFGGLLAQLPAESHPRQRAQALVGLGSIERTYTRLEAAEGYYREALSVLEPLGDPALTGLAQAYLGITLGSQRRHEEGLAALATARVLLERTGDELGLAMVEAGFATIEGDRRRPAAAAPRMERAIERLERFGSHADAVAMRIALAQMRGELLEHAAAEAVSAAVWAEIHDQPRQRLYQMAGAVHAQNLVALGRLDEARAVLGALDRDADAGDDSYQRRQTRLAAVLLEQAQGSREAGAAQLDAFFAEDRERLGDAGVEWWLWLRSLRARGDLDGARAQLPRLARWFGEGDADTRILHALILAEQAWAERDETAALREYDNALQRAEQLGVPALIARVAVSFGENLVADRQFEQAAGIVGRASRWSREDYPCAILEARLFRALGDDASLRAALLRLRALAGQRPIPDFVIPAAEPLSQRPPEPRGNAG